MAATAAAAKNSSLSPGYGLEVEENKKNQNKIC